MSIDLTPYSSIQSNIFVRIQIDEYSQTAGGPYTEEVLRFSDLGRQFSLLSETYLGVGRLMGVTSTSSELRVSPADITITLSGIPSARINEIVNSKIKGAPVRIYRALFNATNGNLLSISGNPLGRFQGFVNNYSLNEEYDSSTRTSTNTLVLTCSSNVSVIERKIAGRRTNPSSQKRFYPNDLSMDRVPNLVNSEFNFGGPTQ